MKLQKNWNRMGCLPRGSSAEWYTALFGEFSIHVENTSGAWRFKVHPFGHESLPGYAKKEAAYAEGLRWLRHKPDVKFTSIDAELSALATQAQEDNA